MELDGASDEMLTASAPPVLRRVVEKRERERERKSKRKEKREAREKSENARQREDERVRGERGGRRMEVRG